jgi:hypothetical protein
MSRALLLLCCVRGAAKQTRVVAINAIRFIVDSLLIEGAWPWGERFARDFVLLSEA